MFRGKKYKDSSKLYDRSAQYDVNEAMDLVVKTATAKFDETIEAAMSQVAGTCRSMGIVVVD